MTTRVKRQAHSCWQLQETGTGTHKEDDGPGKKRHVTESNNSSEGTRIISLSLSHWCLWTADETGIFSDCSYNSEKIKHIIRNERMELYLCFPLYALMAGAFYPEVERPVTTNE
jgi:hypothetical protein